MQAMPIECPKCQTPSEVDFERSGTEFECESCGFARPFGEAFAALRSRLHEVIALNGRAQLAALNAPGSEAASLASTRAAEARFEWLSLLSAWVEEWSREPD